MSKMFLTKYPISLSSDNPIEKLGYILIPITKKRRIASFASTISSFDYEVIRGHFEDINNNEVSYKKYTQAKGSDLIDKAPYYVVPDGDNCVIYISNKYDITRFSNTPVNSNYAFTDKECDFLRYCISLSVLTSNTNEGINLDKISELTELKQLGNYTNDHALASFTGDISNLKNLTKLTEIMFARTAVSGDIAVLKNCTNLTMLKLYDTGIFGDIAVLKNCTNLTAMSIGGTNVIGDISSLKDSKIIDFRIPNSQVSGDIATLANIKGLTYLRLGETKVTGDVTDLVTKATNLRLLEIPTTVTITDEQKQTLTNRGCTVTITDNVKK